MTRMVVAPLIKGGVSFKSRAFRNIFLFATLLLGGCHQGTGETIDYGNHNAEWEDGVASWDEFGHDNDPGVCGLPVLTVEEWEAGRYWEGSTPVLVRNVTDGWPALDHWRLREMLRRYPDAEATMGDARQISANGPEDQSVLIPTTIKEFITKHMYDPSRYFFDRRIGIPQEMVEDCHPFPMPTRAFFEGRDARRNRWRDHLTISIGADQQGLTFHEHGEAWNVVIFGAKRWILWESTSLGLAKEKQMTLDAKTQQLEPAHEWIHAYREHPLRMREIRSNGRDCIQRAGEMMFVPNGCRHMVVNIGDTVAVVSEVDQDGGRGEEPGDSVAWTMLEELLQAESPSIRMNMLRHHLCPGATSVGPNGEVVDLVGNVLVTPGEFVGALSGALKDIYALEEEGGMDRSQAMQRVESVKGVALEARMALAECFRESSDAVNELESALRKFFGQN